MGPGDHGCEAGQARIATLKARDRHDHIIVQEKLDGTNVGVARLNGVIYPLVRAGYVADTSPFEQHWRFAQWVYANQDRFLEMARWAKPLGLTLIAVAHTHIRGVPVDLSWADRTRSVQVPGMLAVVIGNGGHDAVFTDWGWFIYEQNDYREISRSELLNRVRVIIDEPHADTFRADSIGVRPLQPS